MQNSSNVQNAITGSKETKVAVQWNANVGNNFVTVVEVQDVLMEVVQIQVAKRWSKVFVVYLIIDDLYVLI